MNVVRQERGSHRRAIAREDLQDATIEDVEHLQLTQEDIIKVYTDSAIWLEECIRRKFWQLEEQTVVEIVMDAFVKLLDKSQKGELLLTSDLLSVRAWLRTVCVNRAIDLVRKKRHQDVSYDDDRQVEGGSIRSALNEMQAQTLSPEQSAVQTDFVDQVLKTTDLLNEQQREILRLRYYDDLKVEEVADRIGKPVGTVMSSEFYAMKKIRKHFGVTAGIRKTKGNAQTLPSN